MESKCEEFEALRSGVAHVSFFNGEYLHHGVGEYNANFAQNFFLAS
jgi:hypothetical protein